MDLTKFKDLIIETINSYNELFLLDYDISDQNDIKIIIDGERYVNVEDCKRINRQLEKRIDEEGIDASVQVTSPGVDRPLKDRRQFRKNIGRKFTVESAGETYKANLEAVSDEDITLKWKARQKKEIGKGKVTVEKRKKIAFKDINKAVVMINFNKK